MSKATLLWHSKQKSWQAGITLNQPKGDEVEIKSLFSLVSLGTERLLITERIPRDLSNAMKVPYMHGNFNSEFTYGYSLVGKVVEGPPNLKSKIVHLMHPHQNRLLARLDDLTVVPDNVAPKIATLASNMETAINAIWDARIEIGDSVLIIGYGTIGALTASILQKIVSVQVIIHEKDEYRVQVAKSHGFEIFNEGTLSRFDVVYNSTADQKMLQLAIKYTRVEGKIIELSWYGAKSVNINLGNEFHHGRKKIICSQVSMIPMRKQSFWDFEKRKDLVFKLLSKIKPLHLIDSIIKYQDAPYFYNKIRSESTNRIGTIIQY